MNRKTLSRANFFAADIRASVATWIERWFCYSSLYAPYEREHWARCNETTLRHCFPLRRTHQSKVRALLGEPDDASHSLHTTVWHYQILEYWLPYAVAEVFPLQFYQHDITFTFDVFGQLDDLTKTTR